MKNVIVLFLFFSISFQPKAQTSKSSLSLSDLKNCTFLYENLTRIKDSKSRSKTYFYKKKKYSGCAIHPIENQKGFYVYEIVEGKVQREICVYPNGQLERDFRFKNGVSHGKHLMWFDDGNPYIEEEYDNGQPVKMLRWHNNQQLAREAFFKNGKLIKEVFYKRDGSVE